MQDVKAAPEPHFMIGRLKILSDFVHTIYPYKSIDTTYNLGDLIGLKTNSKYGICATKINISNWYYVTSSFQAKYKNAIMCT